VTGPVRGAAAALARHARVLLLGCMMVLGGSRAAGTRPLAAQQRPPAPFFRTDSLLAITLRADLRALLRDRDPDTAIWRGATLSWNDSGGTRAVPLQVRTRGLFRLRHCRFPPIRLRFAADSVRGTPFAGLRRPKLAVHCMDRDDYEQIVLQEYAIYRVLNLVTPWSYAARLVRVTYEDSAGTLPPVTRYGMIIEDPERFADRMGATPVESTGVRFHRLASRDAATLGVFEYLIANTDWSLAGLHNVELYRRADSLYAVPYDFDWAGVINAPYARPAELLPIRNVRDRIYRGFCQGETIMGPVLARFAALRDSIAAVYRAVPGLEPRIVAGTLRYYDEFFREIADPARFAVRRVEPSCLM
jgi:hypothetical protein